MTTFTSSLRFAQPVPGDPAVRDQWGAIWDNTVSIVEQAITGNTGILIGPGTTYSLTVANNAPDQARQFLYPFVGSPTGPCTVTMPPVPKFSLAYNETTQPVTLTTGTGGHTTTLQPSVASWITTDGHDVYDMAPVMSGSMPVGALIQFAGVAVPRGWVLCDGRAISRVVYAALFSVVGGTYGVGDGSTTFNVPDLRGRALFGLDNMGGAAAGRVTGGSGMPATTLGGVGGSQYLHLHGHGVNDSGHTHVLSDPGHGHAVYDPGHNHVLNDPAHTHGVNDPTHGHGVYDPQHYHAIPDPGHVHGISDPGHNHTYQRDNWPGGAGFPIGSGARINEFTDGTGNSGTGISINGAFTGILNTNNSPTYIGIYGSYTGIYNSYSYTGMYMNAAVSNVSLYGSYTGMSVQANLTGISIQGVGAGNSQNMPPAMMINMIIYASV